MNSFKIKAAIVAAAFVLPGAAAAQDESGSWRPGQFFFEQFDANNDGRVTREEFVSRRGERFGEIDADGDGSIDRDEHRNAWQARRAERRQQRFASRDSDGDGRISEEEFLQRPRARFAEIDANDDGFVTQDELEAAREARREGFRRAGDRHGRGERYHRGRHHGARHRHEGWHRDGHRFGGWHHRGNAWHGRYQGDSDDGRLGRFDRDGDGEISRAEYDHATRVMFAFFDRNGDDAIERGEFPPHRGRRGR